MSDWHHEMVCPRVWVKVMHKSWGISAWRYVITSAAYTLTTHTHTPHIHTPSTLNTCTQPNTCALSHTPHIHTHYTYTCTHHTCTHTPHIHTLTHTPRSHFLAVAG